MTQTTGTRAPRLATNLVGLVGTAEEDWRHAFACQFEDPELFFPVGTTGPAAAQIEEAKSVCRRCLVREECLDYAMDTGVTGVWGETSDADRYSLRRRRTRQRQAEKKKTERGAPE